MALHKFSFYEIVRMKHGVAGKEHLGDNEGAILGMAMDDSGNWGYAVHMYSLKATVDALEDELEWTGRTDRRETFYDGTTVRVRVDLQTGEGDIIEPNDE